MVTDTIFALASGHGKCGVAVVRLSGSQVWPAIKQLASGTTVSRIKARQALLSPIHDPTTKEVIDHGLILWFPGPHSFTGEDVCELHVHGGPAVISALYHALGNLEGLRLAEPGEFTKRAFYNGKLDLTEVEGLGDLIHSETEAQRRQAIRQMAGDLRRLYHKWRVDLMKTVAHVEAFIDFSEDENIEEGVLEQARKNVSALLSEVEGHLSDDRRGERLRSGVHVTIVGQPNVGKSTLLNTLCQRPAAIVSPVAGTTRDVLESALNIGGYPVILSDTAGIRETSDEVEMEGVRRARERTDLADVIILMIDAASVHTTSHKNIQNQIRLCAKESLRCNAWLEQRLNRDHSESSSIDSPGHENSRERDLIVVVNKVDLLDRETRERLSSDLIMNVDESLLDFPEMIEGCKKMAIVPMSCKTEEGLGNFLDKLKVILEKMCSNPTSADPYLTQERHRNLLKKCAHSLQSFGTRDDLVMGAEEIRNALRHLGAITGHVTSEEILDVIFKDFCIGK